MHASRGRPDANQPSHAARELLSRARVLALQQTERLESLSEQKEYSESLLDEGAALENEHYTDRVKVLKRHSRLAVTLAPKAMPRSMVADDIVGMTVAGLAMSAALVTIWLAQRNTPYGVLYLAIYVAGYILKDRIKEWGKRYLAPMLAWFGIEFPDRVVKFRDYFGRVVGRCREKVSMKDGLECDARILRMRYSSLNWVPEGKEQVIKPERVLVLAKSMRVRWRQLDAHLQGGVTSLDDLMRIDLHYITRGMQPSREKHLAVKRSPDGQLSVQDIDCARVYHVNSVMEICTQGASPEKSLQLQKTRIILDDEGIKRLEPGGHDHLQRTRRPRLPAAADALRRIRFRSSTEAPLKAD